MILDSSERIKYYESRGFWGKVTLLDYFKRHVEKYNQTNAVVDPPNKQELVGLVPEKLTYAELDRIVDTVATNLIAAGVKKDDVVIVQLPNIWELAMAYLAIARAGGIISPLPMQWRSHELEYLANLTKANMYISTDSFKNFNYLKMAEDSRQRLPNLRHVISLREFREMTVGQPDQPKLEQVKPSPNDVFTICWTSGTEAEPKGCPMTHNNWIALGTKLAGVARIMEGSIQLCNAPLVNMAAIGVVFNTWLLKGGTIVLHHPFEWDLAYQQIVDEHINMALLVPAVLHMILRHPKVDELDISSLTTVTTGSAQPSIWSFHEFKRKWGIEIVNLYGANEGVFFCSGPDEVPDLEKRTTHLPWWGRLGSKWQYGAGIESKIVDPETRRELVKVGEVGELAYKGPNVISGYFGQEEFSSRAFDSEGFYYTGDLFRIVDDSFVSFFDRKKDIIIRGGSNISAQEVENILQGHPMIRDVAVIAMHDDVLGEKACAYVVTQNNQPLTLYEIVSFMKEKGVGTYKIPERIEIIGEIPRNPVGKILKTMLQNDLKKRMAVG